MDPTRASRRTFVRPRCHTALGRPGMSAPSPQINDTACTTRSRLEADSWVPVRARRAETPSALPGLTPCLQAQERRHRRVEAPGLAASLVACLHKGRHETASTWVAGFPACLPPHEGVSASGTFGLARSVTPCRPSAAPVRRRLSRACMVLKKASPSPSSDHEPLFSPRCRKRCGNERPPPAMKAVSPFMMVSRSAG